MNEYAQGTFGFDLQFLSRTDTPVVLSGEGGQVQVLVSAKYQGKVFTSTAEGLEGRSLGYINHRVFAADEPNPHISAYGGENRLWIGPEGGSFSVFFKPGVEQVYDNWFTPAPIDSEPWSILRQDSASVVMMKEMEADNFLGTRFRLRINRSVALLNADGIKSALGIIPNKEVRVVAYATDNSITNLNDFEWNSSTGTVCIWMLDMFNVGPRALTFVPFIEGDEAELGPVATSDYFGPIPENRYKERNGIAFLKTDGEFRSKIGLSRSRTKAIAANYDPDAGHLVVATFDMDPNAPYLNQEWNPKKDPMIGDVMNAYNDGPLDDGSIMGPFLELESDSQAALLKPGETLKHRHSVFHFTGSEQSLSDVTQSLFGVSINQLKEVFNP